MLAFRVGTLPAMLSNAIVAGQLARIGLMQSLHVLIGWLLLPFWVWTVMVALQHNLQ